MTRRWPGVGGGDFVVIGQRDRHISRWGTLAQSQTLPAQPAAWGDTWPRVVLAGALLAAAIGLLLEMLP